MRVVAVIPARYQSSRFPGKPLVDILGTPMVLRVVQQTQKAISEVAVATDDTRILDVVSASGGMAILTRSDHESGTDRIGEAAAQFNLKDEDVVVNVQGDEPFIDPDQINSVTALFEDSSVQIGTLVRRITDLNVLDNPNTPKVARAENGEALYFSRSAIPFHRNQSVTPKYWQHIGLYAYRWGVLKKLVSLPHAHLEQVEQLEQLRWLAGGYRIHCAETNQETWAIDTPKDLETVIDQFKGKL